MYDINLRLNQQEIYRRIENLNFPILNYSELKERLNNVFRFTKVILNNYLRKDYNLTGFERNDNLGKTNPLLWEFGHIFFFYEEMTLRLLINKNKLDINNNNFPNELFDSYLVDRESRFNLIKSDYPSELNFLSQKDAIEIIYDGMEKTLYKLNNYLDLNRESNKIDNYLINIGILHHEMHNESFIFTLQLLGINFLITKYENSEIKIIDKIFYNYKNSEINNCILIDIEYIDIPSNTFIQGSIESIKDKNQLLNNFNYPEFSFDNERPPFYNKINNICVSKYCITNYQFLQFIKSDGYNKKEYWTPEGWRWVKEKKLKYPIYWKQNEEIVYNNINTEYKIEIFGKYYNLNIFFNHPIMNISWYEANAFARYKNARLLNESEWEYLSQQFNNVDGLFTYQKNGNLVENTNEIYEKSKYTISVLDDININNYGVVGLFGNVWEWCSDPIYPYDGFKIDPVYREMSYPYFGFKKSCRGGCWCVSKYLISSSYRNSQLPETTYQYIGFRLAK